MKIADWEHIKLCSVMLDSRVFRGEKSRSPLPPMEPTDKQKDEMGAFAEAFRNFWTAPEVLNSKFTATPAPSGDVYSFAIVLNEIFSREDPYSEETVEKGAQGVSILRLQSFEIGAQGVTTLRVEPRWVGAPAVSTLRVNHFPILLQYLTLVQLTCERCKPFLSFESILSYPLKMMGSDQIPLTGTFAVAFI